MVMGDVATVVMVAENGMVVVGKKDTRVKEWKTFKWGNPKLKSEENESI